jgi:ankyrin repeat protein
MSRQLPLRASLEWLKKRAKERLAELRAQDPSGTLSLAQLEVAREYGFPSWRALKARVDELRQALETSQSSAAKLAANNEAVAADDPELAQLLDAVRTGDEPTIGGLLSRRPALAKAHGLEGETPLHAAAWGNDPKIGAYLMAFGADPTALYGDSGHTALSWAVTCNSRQFAEALVLLGAEPDLFCSAGIGSLGDVEECYDTAGHLKPGSARTGSSRYAPDGTRLPCPPATPREQISDALYIACRNAHPEVVRYLLTKEPDLSFRAYMGATPLHWAYFGGSKAVIDMLLKAGADPTIRDERIHCTPRAFGICAPANWGFLELVRERLNEDAALARLNDGTTTPLHEAARSGSVETVQLLLGAGADPKAKNADGQTPAEIANAPGMIEISRLLGGTAG